MKLALPVVGDRLAELLDDAEHFDIVEIDLVTRTELGAGRADPGPLSPKELARWLVDAGVDLLIVGHLSSQEHRLLDEHGVRVIAGAPSETPRELVKRYVRDELEAAALST
jgi:predicted Fe-Mo cluster-binding NifX family protein